MVFIKYLIDEGMLGASRCPTFPANGGAKAFKIPNLRKSQSSLATHAHSQSTSTAVWQLYTEHLQVYKKQISISISAGMIQVLYFCKPLVWTLMVTK